LSKLDLILGPPGSGKTTTLLQIIEDEANAGVPLSEIAYVSYTKIAVEDAAKRFSDSGDMPYFRTIHSLAYKELGIAREDVFRGYDWKLFSDIVGESVTGQSGNHDLAFYGSNGDNYLRIIDYARNTRKTLEDAYHELDEQVDWFALKRFSDTLDEYKKKSGKVEYSDMLLDYIREGRPVDVRVAVIDEAQDLTAAQWGVVRKAFANAERIYICGDDDQAIYKWSGADVDTFLGLSNDPRVLSHSHRLSEPIHAMANRVAGRISKRYAKNYTSAAHPGFINHYHEPESIDLTQYPGKWFLLGRNRYTVEKLEAYVRNYGINYTMHDRPAIIPSDVETMYLWEKLRKGKVSGIKAVQVRSLMKALNLAAPLLRELKEYEFEDLDLPKAWRNLPWYKALQGIPPERIEFYLECLRRGEDLRKPPRIHLKTIHGVKGAEADHVMLLTDVSAKTSRAYTLAPDNEHRVFYVGITRAKTGLHIILPQTTNAYAIG
jgi:DNA helicase-2/ATP-dependent DNA helicase PcrA